MSDQLNGTYDQPGLPPEQVRVLDIQTEPWSDNRRIKVFTELTPFQLRPDLEISILTLAGDLVSKVDIIENIERKVVFTMHLRGDQLEPSYQVSVKVLYKDIGCVHEKNTVFNLN